VPVVAITFIGFLENKWRNKIANQEYDVMIAEAEPAGAGVAKVLFEEITD